MDQSGHVEVQGTLTYIAVQVSPYIRCAVIYRRAGRQACGETEGGPEYREDGGKGVIYQIVCAFSRI